MTRSWKAIAGIALGGVIALLLFVSWCVSSVITLRAAGLSTIDWAFYAFAGAGLVGSMLASVFKQWARLVVLIVEHWK